MGSNTRSLHPLSFFPSRPEEAWCTRFLAFTRFLSPSIFERLKNAAPFCRFAAIVLSDTKIREKRISPGSGKRSITRMGSLYIRLPEDVPEIRPGYFFHGVEERDERDKRYPPLLSWRQGNICILSLSLCHCATRNCNSNHFSYKVSFKSARLIIQYRSKVFRSILLVVVKVMLVKLGFL